MESRIGLLIVYLERRTLMPTIGTGEARSYSPATFYATTQVGGKKVSGTLAGVELSNQFFEEGLRDVELPAVYAYRPDAIAGTSAPGTFSCKVAGKLQQLLHGLKGKDVRLLYLTGPECAPLEEFQVEFDGRLTSWQPNPVEVAFQARAAIEVALDRSLQEHQAWFYSGYGNEVRLQGAGLLQVEGDPAFESGPKAKLAIKVRCRADSLTAAADLAVINDPSGWFLRLQPGGSLYFSPDGGATQVVTPAGVATIGEEFTIHAMFADGISSGAAWTAWIFVNGERVAYTTGTGTMFAAPSGKHLRICARNDGWTRALTGAVMEVALWHEQLDFDEIRTGWNRPENPETTTAKFLLSLNEGAGSAFDSVAGLEAVRLGDADWQHGTGGLPELSGEPRHAVVGRALGCKLDVLDSRTNLLAAHPRQFHNLFGTMSGVELVPKVEYSGNLAFAGGALQFDDAALARRLVRDQELTVTIAGTPGDIILAGPGYELPQGSAYAAEVPLITTVPDTAGAGSIANEGGLWDFDVDLERGLVWMAFDPSDGELRFDIYGDAPGGDYVELPGPVLERTFELMGEPVTGIDQLAGGVWDDGVCGYRTKGDAARRGFDLVAACGRAFYLPAPGAEIRELDVPERDAEPDVVLQDLAEGTFEPLSVPPDYLEVVIQHSRSWDPFDAGQLAGGAEIDARRLARQYAKASVPASIWHEGDGDLEPAIYPTALATPAPAIAEARRRQAWHLHGGWQARFPVIWPSGTPTPGAAVGLSQAIRDDLDLPNVTFVLLGAKPLSAVSRSFVVELFARGEDFAQPVVIQ